ncbi:hypothetical protein C7212DRAFT_339059 [Tuber magnatum]|uniref:t-SNARE coiled-coil homology domain-containing protein n=1 Tax=Tuber magnatum TaxID=42249 RepID=A0A317SDH4_9PEZI|nr:hypothetical protein C7212DRAFT_339059 [Tuber magnatum]
MAMCPPPMRKFRILWKQAIIPVQLEIHQRHPFQVLHFMHWDVAILKMQTNEIRANMKALDYKIDTKFTQLDHKIDTKFTQLDSKVDTKFYQVSKKFDTLMMLIIGGAVLKGGYDVYKDEFKHSGSKEQV